MLNNHFADIGKKGTMSLTLALIVLDRLNTTERIDVERDSLREAVKVVSAAAKYRISRVMESLEGTTTDIDGNNHVVKQPCCPSCFEPIMNAEQRHINYCPNCGQALRLGYLQ